MNITDNNISYILPLDSISFDYKPEAVTESQSTVQLWKGSSFGEKSHYEFQLFASKNVEESERDSITYDVYRCNICDIDVPKMFRRHHRASSKHKLSLKILETVLERARYCLSNEDDDDPEINENAHFCESCAVVIRVENREQHEQTGGHSKSLMLDKLLKDFLKIYLDMAGDKSNTSSTCNETNDITSICDKTDDVTSICDEKSDLISICDETIDLFSDTSSDLSVLDDDSLEPIGNMTIDSNASSKLNLQEYIDMLNEKTNANNLSAEEDRIKIVALDKSIVRVTEEQFHGFYTMVGQQICGTCQYVISFMDGDIETHKMSSDHIENISAPIEDMHCIRSGHAFKYCLLCNYLVNTPLEEHKQTKLHIDMLNKACANVKASVTKQAAQTKPEADKTYCALCNLYIHTHNYHSHIKGKNHQAKLVAVKKSASITNMQDYDKTYCAPCKIHIHSHNYKFHIQGKNHASNVALNSSINAQNNTWEDTLKPQPATPNIQNQIHQTAQSSTSINKNVTNTANTSTSVNKATANTTPLSTSVDKATAYTTQPSTSVNKNTTNTTSSSTSLDKVTAYTTNTIQPSTSVNKVTAYTTQPSPSVNKITTNTTPSSTSVDRVIAHTTPSSTSVNKNITNATQLSTSTPLHKHVKLTENPLESFCKICAVILPNRISNITEHVNGKNHRSHCEKLIHGLSPHFSVVDDHITCVICQIEVDITDVDIHTSSTLHEDNFVMFKALNRILLFDDNYYCDACCWFGFDREIVSHVSLLAHKELVAKCTVNNGSYHCFICKVNVSNTPFNIKTHLHGRPHKNCLVSYTNETLIPLQIQVNRLVKILNNLNTNTFVDNLQW